MRTLPHEISRVNSPVPQKAEFRIQWRRPGWSLLTSNKGRIFHRREHAYRFADTLRRRGPVSWIRIQTRTATFGPWLELRPSAAPRRRGKGGVR